LTQIPSSLIRQELVGDGNGGRIEVDGLGDGDGVELGVGAGRVEGVGDGIGDPEP
jgi:hypothetical protein